jgi:UDP-N-acetylmuramate dehydrogenase
MTAQAPSSHFFIEDGASLKKLNTFSVPAHARALARITCDADVRRALGDARYGAAPKFVLGGGSNLLLRHDIDALVLKLEVRGMRAVQTTSTHTIVEAGAGENWHDFVAWTLANNYWGLENLALIPGTVGASPVQNIGAYGVELQDVFHSCDLVDLVTGRSVTVDSAQCNFSYRDSIFKRELAGKSCITRVRFALPLAHKWRAAVDYRDVQFALERERITRPTAQQLFDIVCAIRRAKLPDPAELGNAGSFFKNPIVNRKQLDYVLDIDGNLVYYPLEGAQEGQFKLAAGWLIDACGWKGKRLNRVNGAGVYDKQALVLVNYGDATGEEIWQLAEAVQHSVYQRFAVKLEPEPVII